MIRVFISGAHSTGKSTLLDCLLKDSDVTLYGETEVARKVIADQGWQRDDFDPAKNPHIFFDLQLKIIQAQCEVDRKNTELNRSYISDRGLDPLIYCKMFLGEEKLNDLLRTEEAKECIKRHKAAGTLTVILTPHPEYIREDDVRLTPKMEELNEFTELFKRFLSDQGIDFETISDLDLEKRVSKLKSLIGSIPVSTELS